MLSGQVKVKRLDFLPPKHTATLGTVFCLFCLKVHSQIHQQTFLSVQISEMLPHLPARLEDWTTQASPTSGHHGFSPFPSPYRCFLPHLLCPCPSRLLLLCSNKNSRLQSAFSCSITHRHPPPHAIRLSRWDVEIHSGTICLPSSGVERLVSTGKN